MATYTNLSGAGTIALSANVSRLYVDVVTFGQGISSGSAAPTDYFKLGALRLGVQGAYYPVRYVDAAQMVIDVPVGVTTLGYSLFTTTTITVIEVIGPLSNQGLAPWDRNAARVYFGSTANILNGGVATGAFGSYTVPAGRWLMVEHLRVQLFRSTVATTVGQTFGVATVAGSQILYIATYNNTAGATINDEIASALYLPAGTELHAQFSNGDTGGQWVYMYEGIGLLFDA